jgi:hypothetical protein
MAGEREELTSANRQGTYPDPIALKHNDASLFQGTIDRFKIPE